MSYQETFGVNWNLLERSHKTHSRLLTLQIPACQSTTNIHAMHLAEDIIHVLALPLPSPAKTLVCLTAVGDGVGLSGRQNLRFWISVKRPRHIRNILLMDRPCWDLKPTTLSPSEYTTQQQPWKLLWYFSVLRKVVYFDLGAESHQKEIPPEELAFLLAPGPAPFSAPLQCFSDAN